MTTYLLDKELADDILTIIAATKSGEESVSFTLSELRRRYNWTGLGNNGKLEETAQRLGFTLRREMKGVNTVRTYITL